MSTHYEDDILRDSWRPAEPIPLDGPAERNGFSPGAMMVLGLLLALFLFQVVLSPLFIILLLLPQGLTATEALSRLPELLSENPGTLLVANSLGQVFGLALVGMGLARLHSSRLWPYLRFRSFDSSLMWWSLIGLLGLLPVVQWLAQLNARLPLPEWLQRMDEASVEMIRNLLAGDLGLPFMLFALAIVPAICEEVLFRGYVQRKAERRFGIATAIILTGVIFGLYHLRFTQLIPLSVLGIYIGYVLWRTGSIWPAIVVHFANNALLIIAAVRTREIEGVPTALETTVIPWYAVLLGGLVAAGAVAAMHRRATTLLAEAGPAPGVGPSAGSGDPTV
jgi:uncharacterized protein